MAPSWLWSWFRRCRLPQLKLLNLVLYTRRHCHLCDAAWKVLRREQRCHGFALKAVDVDTDANLVARYGDQVPVVAVNGKIRFRGGVNPVLLRRLLNGEASRQHEP